MTTYKTKDLSKIGNGNCDVVDVIRKYDSIYSYSSHGNIIRFTVVVTNIRESCNRSKNMIPVLS